MKNRAFATLGLLALLATASAFGQQRMTVDIPFEFSTGTAVMPAGQYSVTQSLDSGRISLACDACQVSGRFLTHAVGSYTALNESGRLTFNKCGDTYFLASVWLPGSGVGSALPTSRNERETALRASLTPTNQVVLVARR